MGTPQRSSSVTVTLHPVTRNVTPPLSIGGNGNDQEICQHHYPRIPTEPCYCPAETYPHVHGTCHCGFTRTFKDFLAPPIYGVPYSSAEEADMQSVKRLRGQQRMRESIALGARPGVKWTK
jgi:hypothetical protein